MSDTIIAYILGIVEGLAEFLPISSTGHLILVGRLLGFEGEKVKTFEIVIQLGAILAIAVLYHKRLVSLCNIKPLLQKEKKFNALHVFLGVLPAVVAGLLLHDVIKTYLFQPYTVVIGLVAGAILMIFAEVKKNRSYYSFIRRFNLSSSINNWFISMFSSISRILKSWINYFWRTISKS